MVENRANFIPHLYLAPPQGVTPWEFREDLGVCKTRMNGLSCGEESMTIYSAVLIGCQRMTDRQTDGRTDVKPIAITCFSIPDARKNRQTAVHFFLVQFIMDPAFLSQSITAKGDAVTMFNLYIVRHELTLCSANSRQSELANVELWSRANNLNVNPAKCAEIIFVDKRLKTTVLF